MLVMWNKVAIKLISVTIRGIVFAHCGNIFCYSQL